MIFVIMDLTATEWKRCCPTCNNVMYYKSRRAMKGGEAIKSVCKPCAIQKQKTTLAAWDEEKRQTRSERRRRYNLEHYSGVGNPFYGKHHTTSTIDVLKKQDKSYTKTKDFSDKVRSSMIGIDTSVNLIALWTEKFGEQRANELEAERRLKISESLSGALNPMYGKPAPLAAGGGIKGWYRGIHFRSLRELSYMYELDEANIPWRSAESSEFSIVYENPYTKRLATYFPDFIVNETKLVECKPKHFQNIPVVNAKAIAARVVCAERGLTYEFVDPSKLSREKLFELERNGLVKFTERTKGKLNANDYFDERSSS